MSSEAISVELVVGAGSGIGRSIAWQLEKKGESVRPTHLDRVTLHAEDLSEVRPKEPRVAKKIGQFVADLPEVQAMTYALLYQERSRLTDLTEEDAKALYNANYLGLVIFTQEIRKQRVGLKDLIVVNSGFNGRPRRDDSVYQSLKEATAVFGDCVQKVENVGRVLVVELTDELDTMLDPQSTQVADKILELREEDYDYWRLQLVGDGLAVREMVKR